MGRFFQVLIFISLLARVNAQYPAVLESTHDGAGLYSYTFDQGDVPFVWGFVPAFGWIMIQSYEVREIVVPPRWTAMSDSNGVVLLSVTNGIAYLGDGPVTFSIRSASSTPTNYSFLTASCEIVGSFYDSATHSYQGSGYQTFDYVGPQHLVRLQIERSGSDVVLRWPVTTSSYVLESTSDPALPASSWTRVQGVPINVGVDRFLTNDVSGTYRCYRLRRE
jgi:hypothetical protein